MQIDYYHIDTFTDRLFSGTAAKVCFLMNWLSDDILLAIARELDMGVTAFLIPRDGVYHIRWFNNHSEIELSAHATLAAGSVILHEQQKLQGISFHSQSGILTVQRAEDFLIVDLPSQSFQIDEISDELIAIIGLKPQEVFSGKFYHLIQLENERQVRNLKPDFRKLEKLKTENLIITAKGDHVDYVARCFSPHMGINEYPITNTAISLLTPFWVEKLGKNQLQAKQITPRSGDFFTWLAGTRVMLKGKTILFLKGKINLL